MKRSKPRRDWFQALVKRDSEAGCRRCGAVIGVEAAHVIGRHVDAHPPLRDDGTWRAYQVHPDRIIPLCSHCHKAQHEGRIEILGLLTLDEQLQAVADAGSIEAARVRLIPRRLREAA